ncbi:unnamed protein product [Calypogeia fissa]
MRAWKRWSWSTLKVQTSSLFLGPNLQLVPPPVLTRQGHDSSGCTNTLKGELRRLYKLIHPDLLHNQPVEQATNQKSFQLLQEYLTSAKGGEGAKRFVYHFEFYIRSKADDGSLEKVEIFLPPPQTRGRSSHEHELLPTTRKSIGKLFAACGLSISLDQVEERSHLPDLFQEASELQRQSQASQLSLQQQESLISNALLIGGVRVLFRGPVEDAHLQVQVQLLERLAKAVDGCTRINLSGSTFVIGDCYKVDFLGRLWLNSEDNGELWVQCMHRADLVTASKRRVAAKSRQVQEEKVARLVGVERIFTDDALALHPDYSSLLNRLEDGASEHGAVGGRRFSELPVRVSEVESPSLDENVGCVIVPVKVEFTSLYKFIEQRGDQAQGRRRKLKLEEKKLEDLRTHVKKKLRLRYLRFDKKLSPDQLMSACTRLSNHASKLTNYTEGLSLCISDEYQLPSEETEFFVHMKWNFSLVEL